MQLGAFSISLSVKDIHVSKAFYEKMGFTVFAGQIDKNCLIMKNGETLIGLFQGMFQGDMMTFNPGWDQSASNLDSFDDVRDIQTKLKGFNIEVGENINSDSSGPASFSIVDPDGNIILIDQHR